MTMEPSNKPSRFLPKLQVDTNTDGFSTSAATTLRNPPSILANLQEMDLTVDSEKMPTVSTTEITPAIVEPPAPTTLLDFVLHHVTFYRIHLTAFTLIPLIVSGIFYGANGEIEISYLDSLFLCYSAMTVTGLSTVNLSTLTPGQQVILFLLMTIGDITTVSWIMVLIRKRFFRQHCEYTETIRRRKKKGPRKSRSMFLKSISGPSNRKWFAPPADRQPSDPSTKANGDNRPPELQLTSPTPRQTMSGEQDFQGQAFARAMPSAIPEVDEELYMHESPISEGGGVNRSREDVRGARHKKHNEDEDDRLDAISEKSKDSSDSGPARNMAAGLAAITRMGLQPLHRTMTSGSTSATSYGNGAEALSPRSVRYVPGLVDREHHTRPERRRGFTLLHQAMEHPLSPTKALKPNDTGGFPGPLSILDRAAKRVAPGTHQRVKNNLSRKFTITSVQELDQSKLSWLNFSGLIVGRNSDFRTETLSDEQVEELGGVEYRALRFLSYLVPLYFVLCQLVSYTLFAPWLSSTKEYDPIFEAQPKLVPKPWFGLFQVMAAYTGGGMSLVDMGMLPFQNAYLMIFGMIFCILAGNHAMPIFLRFIIWIVYKCSKHGTSLYLSVEFLLDHPRRCFLYLFPSSQTWFLLLGLVGFSIIEWVAFLVLNIGIEAYDSIPTAQRVIAGLFQGLAARASGFAIVPIASFSPALQFLYVVMMYIAIYPIALSIRSTNVYEEQSLGVFEEPAPEEGEEPTDGQLHKIGSRTERVGKYVGWHLRRQMSIDIWWLVWGVGLVLITERHNIMDEEKKWFDVFRVLFELVSAFGGIGLTLGIPTENYSFVGAMKPLSKLIVIVIMVRGRHRGLPVAVDRAIKLPRDMVTGAQAEPQRRRPTISIAERQTPLTEEPKDMGDSYV